MSRICCIPLLIWLLSGFFPFHSFHGEQEVAASLVFIVASITDLFGESGIAFLDMAANQDEFGQKLAPKVAPVRFHKVPQMGPKRAPPATVSTSMRPSAP